MKIGCISDLHINSDIKFEFVKCLLLKLKNSLVDVLIINGDVADSFLQLKNFFKFASELHFSYVFFIPGNHDLLIGKENKRIIEDIENLKNIKEICNQYNVVLLFNDYCIVQNIVIWGSTLYFDGSLNGIKKPIDISELDLSLAKLCKQKLEKFLENIINFAKKTIIFVTHYVPTKDALKVYDLLMDDSDKLYEGCDLVDTQLLTKLDEIKKCFWFYGHMHDCPRIFHVKNLELFNVAVGESNYCDKAIEQFYRIIIA